MSKVLVTGAAGFIGVYVTKHLLAQGYEVIALTNSSKLDLQAERLSVIAADICDENLAKRLSCEIGKCQTVIHLAADIHVPGDGRTVAVNCLGTYHVVELANELEADKFIYLSSVPVIGRPVDIPVTEEHPTHPETLYHITKLTGEGIVNRVGAAGMKKVILRIPSPVGRGMRQNVFLYRMLEQCRKGQNILLYGAGGRVQNYVDVRDVAEAVRLSAVGDAEGVFLIGGESISNLRLAEKCIARTRADVQICFAGVEDAAETERWELSGEKARTVLGYAPGYTLDDTIDWIYGEE